MALYVFAINGMGSYEDGTGMREDMLMQVFNIFNYQAGVVLSTDLLVTQTSPASMAVKVAAGRCFVQNSSYTVNTPNSTKYWGVLVEETTVSVDTNTSGNTRIDLVTIKVDKVTAPDAYATNVASVVVVKGEPGAGTPALPSNSLLIGTLTIPTATTTTITTAMITDSRAFVYLSASPSGLQAYQYVDSNGNIRHMEGGSLKQITVPTSGGSLTGAVSTFGFGNNGIIQLMNGTYTITSNLNIGQITLRGLGVSNGSFGTRIILGATMTDGITLNYSRLENLNIQRTSSSFTIDNYINISEATYAEISNVVIENLGSSSKNETGVKCINAVSGQLPVGINIDMVVDVATTTGTVNIFDLDGIAHSTIRVRSTRGNGITGGGTSSWLIGSNSVRNFVDVITDVAGTDSGTGNTVREIVY